MDLKEKVSISDECEFETEKMVISDVKDDDFDFSFEFNSLPASPVSADAVFFNWRMIVSSGNIQEPGDVNFIRSETRPLWELMNVEKELDLSSTDSTHYSSFSSDVVDDEIELSLVGEEQSFCVWNPAISDRVRKSKRWSKKCTFNELFRKVM